VPTSACPATPGIYDDRVVHVQHYRRHPTDGSQANQMRARSIPGEMIAPAVNARMEQRRSLVSQRITPRNGITLEFIAAPTCKAEIVERSLAPASLRDYVVNRHGLTGVGLGGVAIRAPSVISSQKLLS
jgi:hypothetical protein